MNIAKRKALDFLPLSIENIENSDNEIKKIISINYQKAILNTDDSIRLYDKCNHPEAKKRFAFYKNYSEILKAEFEKIK